VTTHPPYTGPDATCTKCGHTGALTEYRGHGECIHGDAIQYIGWTPNERLHRECERCGHEWDEATVKQQPLVHIGNGANAEDCPACEGTNPPYPFICPGPKDN
jgi:hypothetical protein